MTRHGNTLVARTELGRSERVVLAGHIDTVPHAGELPVASWNMRMDSASLGVGTTDMKAGVAVQLRLAATMDAPNRDVTYVFYECEEINVERNGLFLLTRNAPELLDGSFSVLLEPSGGVVEGGCQGTLRAAINCRKATPGRTPPGPGWGRTRSTRPARSWRSCAHWTPRKPVVDGLEYHEGLNAVAISGGVAGNVVPAKCVVTVNYLLAPDRS